MIVIGGTIQFETDDQDALFDTIRHHLPDSQAEEGCIAYEFSPDISKPNILHLYEEWETAESLEAHGKSAHMAAFKEAAVPSFIATDITRYNAEIAE